MNRRALYSLPLRTVLPAAVMLTLTLLILVAVAYEYRQVAKILGDTALADTRNEMARLQRSVATALSRGDDVAVEREITGQGVRHDLVALSLMDEEGRILYATRFAWKNRPARGVLPGFDTDLAATARRSWGPVYHRSDGGNHLSAYVPVRIEGRRSVSSVSQGLLYLHQDLEPRFRPIWRIIATEAGFLWLAGFAAMGLLMLILHRFVALPMRRLTDAAPLLARGSAAAEIRVAGRGELADLAHAFNDAGRRVRQSMNDLRDREEKYRTIVDNAGQGILLIDRDMTVLEHNRVVAEWFPEVEKGLHCFKAFDGSGFCGFCQASSSMSDGRTRETFSVLRQGDEERHLRIVSSPVHDGEGGYSACVEILEDITDRIIAERELGRVSRALHALSACNGAVVRASDEFLLLKEICRAIAEDAGYRMAWIGVPEDRPDKPVNPVACAGVELDYLEAGRFSWDGNSPFGRGPVGRSICERQASVVQDVDQDPHFGPWREAARLHHFGSVLALPLIVDADIYGSLTVYAEERYAFGADERALLAELADTLAYGIASLRRRDALSISEERLQHLNAELEDRIAARTTELQEANRELEAFSYSVSHDLRAPLRSIDGFGQLLLRRYTEQLDERGRDYLERVCRATRRMGQLIDDLLGLSRINRHQMKIETVDISNIARCTLRELQAAAPERRTEVSIAPNLTVEADSSLVQVLITNLLGNAWKYTGKNDAGRIELGAEAQDGATLFFIRDNGAGFDMAYADKLFEPFKRLHREDEFEGTGIGLATVHRILLRHGGAIWAEGAPGRGATFHFRFGPPAV